MLKTIPVPVGTESVVEPTAAGALATEAAFMENIGLYLNPISKPLLNALQPAMPNKIGGEPPSSAQADTAVHQDPSGLAQAGTTTHLDNPASKTPFTAWEDELLLEWSSAGPAGPPTSTQDQV